MPTEILELGQLIVKELKLDPGTDTLGRWMAHHIAEMIPSVEGAPNEEIKRERSAEAYKAIQDLWSHRSTFDNRINPLFELKPIIQVLRNLNSSKNIYFRQHSSIHCVYDSFRRLIISLLLRKMESANQLEIAVSHGGQPPNSRMVMSAP
jgi:hypothetical protein